MPASWFPAMSPDVSMTSIALRLGLATISSAAIGFNRDERSHPAGLRTIMLVCMAATLASLELNLLLPTVGKAANSFVQIDPMRLPLGILTGIGFIGAGAIVRRDNFVTGLTTAATIWVVTVLGILFGAGQLVLGSIGAASTIFVLWILEYVDDRLPRKKRGTLSVSVEYTPTIESEVIALLASTGFIADRWRVSHDRVNGITTLSCDVTWKASGGRQPRIPRPFTELRALQGLRTFSWEE
ncbi:MgtC/SapB family protein [Terriglobus tenax]|uniref:MgtC/SapB family protein n=1 Tax=Terriglobus tenax TaxID=1111115 RepID=UPI0021DF6A9B|nr:MgtC/SapB family protein [Terriglobus tenax]